MLGFRVWIPGLTATLAVGSSLLAQVNYVDAVAGGNTTLADGSPFVPSALSSSADNNWQIRAFANGASVYEANAAVAAGMENAPMLRTTIAGLTPGRNYHVYSYFWCAEGGQNWRGRSVVDTVQPAPEIATWNTVHACGAVGNPTRPLGIGSVTGTQPRLNLAFNAGGIETSGHFRGAVMIREGNRWLFEAPLGVFAADASGEIQVYVDDIANPPNNTTRTWFDGVGYEDTTSRAPVFYMDAVAGGNTTLADGSAFVPSLSTTSTDNNWAIRTLANGATVYESNGETFAGQEDAPMLRTTLAGFAPGSEFEVYAYFWGTDGTGTWNGRAAVASAAPAPQIQRWDTTTCPGSNAMTPLGKGSPRASLMSLGLTWDAAGFETSGHFATPVLIQEGNRWLFEAPLGRFVADASGSIHVYIDDLENPPNNDGRTWFDGIGIAPTGRVWFGAGCGAPSVPTIACSDPAYGRPFTVGLSGAPASAACILVLGFDRTTWSGFPLPLDLGLLGFPGCALNVAMDVTLPGATDANGAAAFTIVNQGAAANAYWQWMVVTPAGPSLLHVTSGLQTLFH